MQKQIFQKILVKFESGKDYFQKFNSLTLISTWTESLESIITEDGRRTRLLNSLYFRLPQLTGDEQKTYNSIKPLSQEENTIIAILKVLDGLYSLESIITSDNHMLIMELIDIIIGFLKNKTGLKSD